MRGEAALSASCFFCGEKWTKKNVLGSRSRNKSSVRVEIVNAWEERCIVSTCRMLRIPPTHPALAELLCIENYCAGCKQLMRDVEFSVGAIDKLQQQILNFRRMLLAKLESNSERLQSHRKDRSSKQTNSSQELFNFVFEKAQERAEKFSDDDSNGHECYDDQVKEETYLQLPLEDIEIKEEVFCVEDDGELFLPANDFDELNSLTEVQEENPEFKIVPEGDVLVELDIEDEQIESSADEISDSDPEWTLNSEDEVEAEEAMDINIETQDEADLEKTDELPEMPQKKERSQSNLSKRKRKLSKPSGEKKNEMNERAVKTKCNQIKSCPHPNCKLNITSVAALDSHIRNVHGEEEKLLPCDECDKKFALMCSLQAHKSLHRKQDWRKDKKRCEFCGVWLKSEEVEEHEERHRSREFPFSCLICEDSEDSKFLGVYHLSLHMRDKHPMPYLHKCHLCEKSCVDSQKLNQHLTFAHGDSSTVHSCEQCKNVFKTSRKLKKHMRSVHPVVPTNRKEFICEKCGKICTSRSHFNIHIQTHSDTFPFKCKFCGKCFKLDRQVKKHEEIHAGLKFQCPNCPKTFTTQRYLIQHSRCHLPREKRKYYYKTKEPAAESVFTEVAS